MHRRRVRDMRTLSMSLERAHISSLASGVTGGFAPREYDNYNFKEEPS